MLFWLNEKIEKNNIIILSKQAILVSSCGRGDCQNVRAQLEKKVSPVKLFGKANISMIPLIKIQAVSHQEKTPILHIVVGINAAGKERTIKLAFSDVEARDKCSALIKKLRLNAVQNTPTKQDTASKQNTKQEKKQKPDLPTKSYESNWTPKPEKPNKLDSKNKESAENVFEYEEVKLKDKFLNKKIIKPAVIAAVALAATLFFLQKNPDSLYEAIQSQKITTQQIDKLLEDGADINYRGTDGVTPLLSAINYGNEDIIISLVNKGADLSNKYNGETALDMAIANGLDKAVYSMLNKKAPTSNNKNLLIRAIQNKLSTSSVKKIINLGADVNYTNENGSSVLATALLFTAKKNIIHLLLNKGASTDIKINGVSPAMFARTRGRKDLSKLIARYEK